MNSAVKNKTEDPEYSKRLKIATKAFEGGYVIFSTTSQKWYTPREFLDSDERVIYTRAGVSDVPNINFYYPAHAIKKRIEKLQIEENDFKDFMDRVIKAFEIIPKKKPKKENQATKRNDELVFHADYQGQSTIFHIGTLPSNNNSWVLLVNYNYLGLFLIKDNDWVFRPKEKGCFTEEQQEIILNKMREFRPVKESK